MHPVRLAGITVVLRELIPDDAHALYRVYGDADATRHLSFEPRSLTEVRDIIAAAISDAAAEPRTVHMLAIADPATGELTGAARLALGEHQSATIGFALRPDQWGHGKGTETVRLLQRLGFAELGLHRIWGARSPRNLPSARTLSRAG